MKSFPRAKEGDLIGVMEPGSGLRINRSFAALLSQAGIEIERLGKLTVSPPLLLIDGTAGRRINYGGMLPIPAKLSGAGNPYAFTQQEYDPNSDTWSDMPGGRIGDNAYESHDRTGLGDRIVWLTYVPTAADWRFQWAGMTPPPPPTCAGIICVQVTTQCSGPPATVYLMQGGSPINSATVKNQVYQLTLGGGGGSGYANGTNYALGFSGGSPTTPATGLFDVVAGKVTNLRLTSGGSGYGSSPAVSFPGAGSGTGATATASVGARACFGSVPHGTGYSFVGTSPDYLTRQTGTFNVPPCTNPLLSLSLPPKYRTITVQDVVGCGSTANLSGVEVEASQNGTSETQNTDASGDCTFSTQWLAYDAVLQPYPVTLTFRKDRYQERSITFNLASGCTGFVFNASGQSPPIFTGTGCSSGTLIQNDVLEDYVCLVVGVTPAGPVSKSLTLTEPVWGSTANLSFVGCTVRSIFDGYQPTWRGSGTASIPALCAGQASNCGAGKPLETFSCDPVALEIRYELHGGKLYLEWDTHRKPCPTSGEGGKRCLGPGLDQALASIVINMALISDIPALIITGPLPANGSFCDNPFGNASGDISIVEA